MTLVPNTFQSFNVYIDRAMELLSDAEFKVLMFSTRHIMGWQDKIDSRIAHISISMFEHGFTDKHGKTYCGTGLGRASIINALNVLVHCGFLDKVGEPTADGQAWKLSERDIHWDYLAERKNIKAQKGSQQTEKARAMKSFVMVLAGLSNLPAILVSPTNQRWLVQLTIAGLLNKLNQRQDKTKSKPIKETALEKTPTPYILPIPEQGIAPSIAGAVPDAKLNPHKQKRKERKQPARQYVDTQELDNGLTPSEMNMWKATVEDTLDFYGEKCEQIIAVMRGISNDKYLAKWNFTEPLTEPAQICEFDRWWKLDQKSKGVKNPRYSSGVGKVIGEMLRWKAAMRRKDNKLIVYSEPIGGVLDGLDFAS